LDHIRCLRSPNNLKDIIFIKTYIFVMPWDQGSFWPMNKITSGRGEFQAVRISKREGENLRCGLTCSNLTRDSVAGAKSLPGNVFGIILNLGIRSLKSWNIVCSELENFGALFSGYAKKILNL
jgi:hypothetical protein